MDVAPRAWLPRMAVWLVAAVGLVAGAGQPPEKAEPPKPAPRPKGAALDGPRYVFRPQATFTFRVQTEEAARPYKVVAKRGEETVAEAPVGRLRPLPAGKAAESEGEIAFEAAAWPDGAYAAEVHPAGPGAEAGPYATLAFQVVRQQVEKDWQGDLRDEFTLWLDHANRFNSGKFKVLCDNVDRVLKEPGLLYAGLRGLAIRSYWNPQLKRRQPYTVYVPQAYDPKQPMALMILLHGSGYDYLNIFSDIRAGQEFETNPLLVANAGAFRQQEFRTMAFNDVFWVLEDMKTKYAVDEDRVYCQGISLGGRGTMELAALRPEAFAALSPQGVYGTMQEPNDLPFYLWQDEWSRWSVARWDFRSYLPNLRNIPLQIIYGFRDKTTPPLNALTYVHLLNKRFGGKAEAVGFDADHNISFPVYKWSDTRAWFLKHRREKAPRIVTARTASLRFNRFYWVTIEAFQVQWQMAEVVARSAGESLSVEARNVARLALEPPDPCRRATVNGQDLDLGPEPVKRVVLACGAEGAWRVPAPDDKAAPTAGPVKRHGSSGPIWDVLHGRCLSVYGTKGSEQETEGLKAAAAAIARLDAAWGDPSWPVLADTEVTEAEKKTCNLMLAGDARTNALLAGGRWPFDLARIGRGEGIEVFGETYNAPGDVLQFIYPSPFADGTYVYVVSPAQPGKGPAAVLNPCGTWDVAVWSDWVVRGYGGRLRQGEPPPGRGEGRRRGGLADGIFDAQWRLQKMPGALLQAHPMNWE